MKLLGKTVDASLFSDLSHIKHTFYKHLHFKVTWYIRLNCFTDNFSAQTMCASAIWNLFLLIGNLCTINSQLLNKSFIYFCLCLQTVGLVSQARPFLFCSADRFQYSYWISDWHWHGKAKGQACATNLSFKKVISWQDIISALKTMSALVQKMPKQQSTQRICCGKSSEKTKPA